MHEHFLSSSMVPSAVLVRIANSYFVSPFLGHVSWK
ncbi:Cytolethal distending toxin subunit B-like protein [Bienertia sinuspersici]